jgi:DNA-binding MarR family transcriptional regulator
MLRKRWRSAADTGFVAVPTVLLTYFRTLNITPTEFVVLLNLLAHWWSADRGPFPRVSTIARRMDTSPRTVQRALNRLRAIGLIDWQRVQVRDGKILSRAYPGDGIRRRLYDLGPLVAVADRLAADRLEFLGDRAERGRHTEIAA